MNKVTFQAALPEDLPEIMALQVQVFAGEQQIPEPLVRSVQDAHPQWWCAMQNGKLLGTVAAWQENGVTHWGRFAVQPAFRGQGIGKQLARYSMEQLFAQQVQRIYMEAREATVHIICQMGGVVIGPAEPFFVGTVTPVELTSKNFTQRSNTI